RSREPLVISDTSQEPRWVALDKTAWIKSYLSLPLCLRDRVLGLLRLDGATPGEFSAEDAQRLLPLASAAAIAIENAQLVEGLEDEVAVRTAEIVAEKEKSETILRNVDDAIAMSDLEMRLRYVNSAFTALTGYTAQEAIGQHVSFLFKQTISEQDGQSLWLALAQGNGWRGEVSSQRKDGRPYEAAMTIAPMRDAAGCVTGYVSSHRNISRHKALERARSRFITNISHQLRTPVTTIQTYTYLLRKGGQPEKTGRYLQMVDDEIARLIHLIQDILAMTVLDSGEAVSVWEPISLSTVIEDTVARYQSRAEASSLTLVARPFPPDLRLVNGDQARLTQALGEIVENAIIFTPGGGQVTIETKTAVDEDLLWVVIAVQDTGPGISPEEQEHVFDCFFRGVLAESGHVPGTGLGLSIAEEMVRAHGGRVTVESAVGKGSTFRIWLPPSEHDSISPYEKAGRFIFSGK
ncbi:MAG: PAS domain S-box protein, partial [Chloroflexi bacterium]|nr:PAS domain S-box protein [Chloroflexota bacterium]